jgi:hypothetical protein
MKKHDLRMEGCCGTDRGPLYTIVSQTKKGKIFLAQQIDEDDEVTPNPGSPGEYFVHVLRDFAEDIIRGALRAGLTIKE